jgi:hypothetical protein
MVAKVPGVDPSAEHRPVVDFGVANGLCIAFAVEGLVLGEQPVAARVLQRIPLNVDQLVDSLLLARRPGTERRRKPVGLPVVVRRRVVEA